MAIELLTSDPLIRGSKDVEVLKPLIQELFKQRALQPYREFDPLIGQTTVAIKDKKQSPTGTVVRALSDEDITNTTVINESPKTLSNLTTVLTQSYNKTTVVDNEYKTTVVDVIARDEILQTTVISKDNNAEESTTEKRGSRVKFASKVELLAQPRNTLTRLDLEEMKRGMESLFNTRLDAVAKDFTKQITVLTTRIATLEQQNKNLTSEIEILQHLQKPTTVVTTPLKRSGN